MCATWLFVRPNYRSSPLSPSTFLTPFLLLYVLRRSYHSIAKEAGVGVSTVQGACRNFVEIGRPKKVQKGKQPRVIPEEILNYITSTDALNEMKFLSLK